MDKDDKPNEMDETLIDCFTRKDALAAGVQFDVSPMAEEAGFRFPTFLTESVYRSFVVVPPGVSGQDVDGRLWDILWMLKVALARGAKRPDRLSFQLYVRNSDHKAAELVTLAAVCGPYDIDDPKPAITIMLPGED